MEVCFECETLHRSIENVFIFTEFMVEARYFSVDPYVQNKCKFLPLGSTVVGFQMGM